MAYRSLTETNPVSMLDRVTDIEAEINSATAASLLGTHFYAEGGPPVILTSGTDTAGVANTIFLTEIRTPANILITGISFLVGTVGTTDKVIVFLFDSLGNILATSAVAGVLVGSPAVFQRVPFITPYQAAAGQYYIGVQSNGTHATYRLQAGGDHNTGTDTTQTFGTPVKTTPPTSFTAATGPIAMTY